MDAIYGHRPANQDREGGLDSATALLESMIEPVDTVDGLSNDASNFSDDGPSTSFSSTSTISSSQPQSSQPHPMHPSTLVKGDSCSWICAQSWRICGQQRKGS
ncbi:hypothetical protein AB205_0089480 [Aquarana catesbeiana]|uniref:Uncharacterized protein n=1 Tax=Aquarana catesbeiana TaxID=8400 RepID=A0A2G9RRE6_AQUCT|nr:hypothetical protein AB205_0089480 [Aquarana catesbeiana]